MTDRVPDLLVERLALGELDADEAKTVRERLEAEGDDRLEQIEASNREILEDYPAAEVARQIRRRAERDAETPAAGWARWIWLPAAAVATALVLWFVTKDGAAPVADQGDDITQEPIAQRPDIRLKGDARLVFQRMTGNRLTAVKPDDTLAAGDAIQVSYVAGEAKHGVIVSIDGGGSATLHYPQTESSPTTLHSGGAQRLPFSFELDDAPQFERFFFVTAEQPLPPAEVMAAARELAKRPDAKTAPLSLSAKWGQRDWLLRKGD